MYTNIRRPTMEDMPNIAFEDKEQLYMDEMICGCSFVGEKERATVRVDPAMISGKEDGKITTYNYETGK